MNYFLFNEQIIDDYEEVFEIRELIVHENYLNATIAWDYDIALLRVKAKNNRGIRFSPHVQPLWLPPMNAPYIPGTLCDIYGWGIDECE